MLGCGISIEVAPDALLVPGEGVVGAITDRTGKRFGSVKIVFDVTLVAIDVYKRQSPDSAMLSAPASAGSLSSCTKTQASTVSGSACRTASPAVPNSTGRA